MLQFIEISPGEFVSIELGAFGGGPFGGVADVPFPNTGVWVDLATEHPFSPQNLQAKPGLEGPQAVLTWDGPANPIHRIMIRRKRQEYPRTPADGFLVLDEAGAATSLTSCVDNVFDTTARTVSRFILNEMGVAVDLSSVSSDKSLFDILDTDNDGVISNLNADTEAEVFDRLYTEIQTTFDITISADDRSNLNTFSDLFLFLEPHHLLTTTTPGDSAWWYYRMFYQPNPTDVEKQFGGLGKQTITKDIPANPDLVYSTAIDIQEYENVSIIAKCTKGSLEKIEVYFSPVLIPSTTAISSAASGAVLGHELVDAAGLASLSLDEVLQFTFSNSGHKYIYFRPVPTQNNTIVDIYTITNQEFAWRTNQYTSRPCLVYKTGRHLDVMYNQKHLPTFLTQLDQDITRDDRTALLPLSTTTSGRVNLWDGVGPKGPLYRFLKLMSLELDRDHAYFGAIKAFDLDIFEAPESVLQHIAFELGWQVDTSRPLLEVREELAKLAGFYKTKGRPHLMQATSSQELGVVGRVQEGPGLVVRAANPALFDVAEQAAPVVPPEEPVSGDPLFPLDFPASTDGVATHQLSNSGGLIAAVYYEGHLYHQFKWDPANWANHNGFVFVPDPPESSWPFTRMDLLSDAFAQDGNSEFTYTDPDTDVTKTYTKALSGELQRIGASTPVGNFTGTPNPGDAAVGSNLWTIEPSSDSLGSVNWPNKKLGERVLRTGGIVWHGHEDLDTWPDHVITVSGYDPTTIIGTGQLPANNSQRGWIRIPISTVVAWGGEWTQDGTMQYAMIPIYDSQIVQVVNIFTSRGFGSGWPETVLGKHGNWPVNQWWLNTIAPKYNMSGVKAAMDAANIP